MLLVPVRPYVHCARVLCSKAQDTTDEVAVPQTRARFTTACADLSMILLTLRRLLWERDEALM